jgi:predicted alpha/beta superfamily hydrolase
MKFLIRIILASYFIFLSFSSFAQDKTFAPRGDMEIASKVLKEQRKLKVFLPDNYDTNDSISYPVIYVLDGEWHTGLNNWNAYKLAQEGVIPPAIIVGIINVDRNRDFLPTHVGINSTSGKAKDFLEFISKELKPYIDSLYNTSGRTALVGHSFGGVFTMYALLTSPDLFDAHVVSDPPFGWDDGYMIKLAKSNLSILKGKNKVVFIAGRSGQPMSVMGISRMKTILKKYAPEDLVWTVKGYPEETHDSVTKKSFMAGLRYCARAIE